MFLLEEPLGDKALDGCGTGGGAGCGLGGAEGRIAGRRLQGRREHHRAARHDPRPVTPDQKLPAVFGIVRDWRHQTSAIV